MIAIKSALAAGLMVMLGACQVQPMATQAASVKGAPTEWADECADVAGYADFRRKLINAVDVQDATELRGLFASDGRMRMNGVGGDRNSADWGLDRANAIGVWAELRQILALGCATRKNRLYLPAMAVASPGASGGDVVIATRDTFIHSSPDRSATILRRVPMGQSLSFDMQVSTDWKQIVTKEGAPAFVPAQDVRSPTSTVIELAREGDAWRIQWLGGNL